MKKYATLIVAHDIGSEIQAYLSLIYEAQQFSNTLYVPFIQFDNNHLSHGEP